MKKGDILYRFLFFFIPGNNTKACDLAVLTNYAQLIIKIKPVKITKLSSCVVPTYNVDTQEKR